MSARQPHPYDSVARKWLALAERRRAHLLELRENGRGQRYYTDAQLAEQLHELDIACRRFAEIGGAGALMAEVDGADSGDHDTPARDAA
jgi:hypothetical protein